MPTSRTRASDCAICGKRFTARWQFNPYNRYTSTCSNSCARKLGEKNKREAKT